MYLQSRIFAQSFLAAAMLLVASRNTLQASTIQAPVTFSNGSLFTGTGANNNHSGQDLLGATVTAIMNGGPFTCTFDGSGQCLSAGNFSAVITPATSQTNSANWIINNLRAAGTNAITSVSYDLAPAKAIFFICIDGSGNPTGGGCGGGKTAHSVSGGSTDSANAAYANGVAVDGSVAPFDHFTALSLSFTTSVVGGDDFQFGASTIGVRTLVPGTPPPNVPEPATYALVGAALLGLGLVRHRIRT